jgi:hypothetical protein
MRYLILAATALVCQTLAPAAAAAQERPFFVTYDHSLVERGDLEVSLATTSGVPKDGDHRYNAPWLELEYGVTSRWTTEFYLEGTFTAHDGSAFTGWRWENRFRPFREEHVINPVLYVEYESLNEASRIQKEIVGSGRLEFEPISMLSSQNAHELEGKLILSSIFGRWNVAENFTLEKNLSQPEGVEFGYSAGVSRRYGSLTGGLEIYGGLGSTLGFEGDEQRHYIAPAVAWNFGHRGTVKGSIAAGLTSASDRMLIRLAYVCEFRVR